MPGTIVVVGSINMDLVVHAPYHPQPGETILGSDFQTYPGGKGANQAVAAARLGGRVLMVGRVGNDAFGDSMLANLRKDGIDTRYVQRTEGVASGVALITVSDSGQNNIVVVPGSNARLSPKDIQDAEPALREASVILLQLEIPIETVTEAIHLAKKHGVTVVLNPAPAHVLSQTILSQVDTLVPNENELLQLTGETNIQRAIETLTMVGVKRLIVTLGSEGVLVADDAGQTHLLPHHVKVVDTTAAGDAFVGAFAVALTEGKNTRIAAEWGNAAGALAVTGAGAQPSLPTRAMFDTFLALNPAREEASPAS